VLGVLIEKERATPEYYPLTLNALVNGCNQKSNRDPVMQLDDDAVTRALDTLRLKELVCLIHTAGSRAPKHAHRLGNFFNLSPQEFAVLCLLLLRGPQTAGEMRTRSGRLCAFASPSEVEAVLQGLAARDDGPFVVKLARQPGQSSSRYAHLLCGPVDAGAAPATPSVSTPAAAPANDDRLAVLEREVAELRAELEQVKQQLGIAPASSTPTP